MKASARNETALGPKRGVAYFTQALVRALEGGAAIQSGGAWVVLTGQVSARITEIMRMIKTSEGFRQRCSSQVTDSTEILRAGVPKVALVVACKPEHANPHARLTCSCLHPPGLPDTEHEGAPWTLEVDAGLYVAKAQFPAGDFRDAATPAFFATPPSQKPILECAP